MHFSIFGIVLASTLCTLVSSQNISYNVISVTNQSMGVLVDGKTYQLEPTKDIPILYTGKAPFGGNYTYVKIDKLTHGIIEREPFIRSLQRNEEESTSNEFYNRTWNTKQSQPLPQLLDNLPIMNRIDTQLHKEDSITTFYIQGNQSDIDLMHKNSTIDTKVIVNLTLIENNKTQILKGVEIKISGRSSRWMDKLSYGIKIPKGQDLYGYRRLKLRALRTDPSYIREKLCYDLMKSVGLPVSGSSYTRLIMNNQPIGLFLMIEAYKNPWYKNVFANGEKLDQGITYQGAGFVTDLSYMGNNITKYNGTFKIEEDPDKGSSSFDKIMEFTKFVSEAPVGEGAEIIWNQHIDMDSVIRSLVIEIAAGFSDGYIANADNYFLYDNLKEKRLTYLAADFDMSMGNTIVKLSDQWSGNYTQYPGFSIRPLTKVILQVPAFKSQFEQLLQNVTQNLVNPKIANQRIDDLFNFLDEDVAWDKTLPKVSNMSLANATMDPNTSFQVDIPSFFDQGSMEEIFTFRPKVSLYNAINGPTGYTHLPGVKEWFINFNNNTHYYFSQFSSSH